LHAVLTTHVGRFTEIENKKSASDMM